MRAGAGGVLGVPEADGVRVGRRQELALADGVPLRREALALEVEGVEGGHGADVEPTDGGRAGGIQQHAPVGAHEHPVAVPVAGDDVDPADVRRGVVGVAGGEDRPPVAGVLDEDVSLVVAREGERVVGMPVACRHLAAAVDQLRVRRARHVHVVEAKELVAADDVLLVRGREGDARDHLLLTHLRMDGAGDAYLSLGPRLEADGDVVDVELPVGGAEEDVLGVVRGLDGGDGRVRSLGSEGERDDIPLPSR